MPKHVKKASEMHARPGKEVATGRGKKTSYKRSKKK